MQQAGAVVSPTWQKNWRKKKRKSYFQASSLLLFFFIYFLLNQRPNCILQLYIIDKNKEKVPFCQLFLKSENHSAANRPKTSSTGNLVWLFAWQYLPNQWTK